MLKRILLTLIASITLQFSFAQSSEKTYFDKGGKATQESYAYYYRTKTGGNTYKSFYFNGGTIFFEGSILTASTTDENQNVYSGKCTWYYKNGKTKCIRSFNDKGQENGLSSYFYESGKLWKEMDYVNGKLTGNTYKEYDEEGMTSQIFEENFDDNINDWDVYISDKSNCIISNGKMELESFAKEGTSRYISVPNQSDEIVIEALLNTQKLKAGDKVGIIYGFKDWQNYHFFLMSQSSFYIGLVYEGVTSIKADGMYSTDIVKDGDNNLKIITAEDKAIFSINGQIQYKADRMRNFGSNFGVAISGKSGVTVDKLTLKQINFKGSGVTTSNSDMNVSATGSGIIFSTTGHIITNHHVIDNANKIVIEVNAGGVSKSYNARVIQKDIDNDLAIIQIDDASFQPLNQISYSFKESGAIDVGASVFTIGYPLALSGMGKEAKFTDGKVSAKTGYNNAINSYQTSIPVQPGNSGGPVFNEKGELVGLINSKVKGADNVSYAIKLNYIKNLIESLPQTIATPNTSNASTVALEDKIKILSPYVVLIKIK